MLSKPYFRAFVLINVRSMANKMTDMSKVRKVIQLHHQKKGKLFISRYLAILEKTLKMTT